MPDDVFADLMKKLQEERAKGASLDQTTEKRIEGLAEVAKKGKFNPLDLVILVGKTQAMETPEEKAAEERAREAQFENIRKHQEEYRKKQEIHKQERIRRGLMPEAGTGKPEPAILPISPRAISRRRSARFALADREGLAAKPDGGAGGSGQRGAAAR